MNYTLEMPCDVSLPCNPKHVLANMMHEIMIEYISAGSLECLLVLGFSFRCPPCLFYYLAWSLQLLQFLFWLISVDTDYRYTDIWTPATRCILVRQRSSIQMITLWFLFLSTRTYDWKFYCCSRGTFWLNFVEVTAFLTALALENSRF